MSKEEIFSKVSKSHYLTVTPLLGEQGTLKHCIKQKQQQAAREEEKRIRSALPGDQAD